MLIAVSDTRVVNMDQVVEARQEGLHVEVRLLDTTTHRIDDPAGVCWSKILKHATT